MWWLLALLFMCFGLVVFRGAPYVPTHKKQVEIALDLLDLKPGEVLVDLGSGDGVLLKAAAKRGIVVHGYELNPLLCAISYVRCWRYRTLVRVHWRDFWLSSLPPDTKGVFVFLAEPYMARFARKIRAEAVTGVRVVSYGFKVPGFDVKQSKAGLHLYTPAAPQHPGVSPLPET